MKICKHQRKSGLYHPNLKLLAVTNWEKREKIKRVRYWSVSFKIILQRQRVIQFMILDSGTLSD